MQRRLFLKVAAIGLLSMLLLIPLWMIEAQIAARGARQADVVRDIAESAAAEQTLIGPVLVVRYRERVKVRDKEVSGREAERHEVLTRSLVLPPQVLGIDGDARVETRSRGLYRASLYHLALDLRGRVSVPARLGLGDEREILSAQAILVLGVSDLRGVANDPEVTVNGRSLRFTTGNAGAFAGPGLQLALGDIDPAGGAAFEFALPLSLTGSARLAIAPVGESTTVALRSAWPHPSFQGRFLPVERKVGADGFEARWQVSHLARDFGRALAASDAQPRPETLAVSFIEPVNVYLQAERAVKYGVLFVVLTFAAFFIVEVLRRRPIHPLQYLLVGLALAVFFLLLVALSEHLSFALAYAISATACVLLIGGYLAAALGARRHGLAFGAGLAVLYGVLYGVLLSEDNALLMGSLLLFGALGVTMLTTRRIDWYRLGGTGGEDADEGYEVMR
ncbi:cell envelope integrity protein CreD [Azoarcus communis]|uniref:Cell envelope integrity protein CreD n=1 Tax=Parazoarcus communis SWub3 = DSM 12120 TaxID=1121029 RepID=A0A323V048_9RHOO|nr:cell envelope integrity protein CreD [Parazoarcus communis]NMG47680.1 cell envelope integrity protein CreD [Parazoarcus communis]NMG68729.1 cell envelope integrity protein CreD [Parazoarcus communis SWub3 = DSM 12120]PZA17851.1 cell envelope integrity protein CreD [Azoarcus communis] [Parazoarcus communis SWub3 = DSM 12120]